MKIKNNSLLILIIASLILLAVGIFYFIKFKGQENKGNLANESQLADINLNANNFDTPFTYQIPSGWNVENGEFEINSIKGGGPLKRVFLTSPASNEFSADSMVELSWFNFNPAAPLEDIVPLLNLQEGSVIESRLTQLSGKDTYHIVSMGGRCEDCRFLPYRSEFYLLRLPDLKLLEIQIFYYQKENLIQYQKDVEVILNSLKFI